MTERMSERGRTTLKYMLLWGMAAPGFLMCCLTTPVGASDPQTVVVELFTSEGCSSCPPADRLVGELAKKHEADSVYLLAFHVDYWNYLGWIDRLSDAAFSDRQRSYARALRSRFYTPQMIVDGRIAFVGSRRRMAVAAIADQLASRDEIAVDVDARVDAGAVVVSYCVDPPTVGPLLNVALVSRLRNN